MLTRCDKRPYANVRRRSNVCETQPPTAEETRVHGRCRRSYRRRPADPLHEIGRVDAGAVLAPTYNVGPGRGARTTEPREKVLRSSSNEVDGE